MKGMFVDTSGWMVCEDEADPKCPAATKARDMWLDQGGILISTDYVVAETLTLLRVRLGLHVAEAWWQRVDSSMRMRWEAVDSQRTAKAREIFFRHSDKDYSFTDCTSFVVMKELKLKCALATDKHFAQAGFQILPAR